MTLPNLKRRVEFIWLPVLTLAIFLMTLRLAFAGSIAPAELPDLVEKVLPQVVNISSTTIINYRADGMEDFMRLWGVPTERKQSSLGSGFIIDSESGYVLTNYHVVDHATEVLVVLSNKKQYRAKIIGKDQKMDLALLQIRDDSRKVPGGLSAVSFGDSDRVRIGEPVFAVGNPFGLQHTVTTGIISAKNRTIGVGPFDNFLQTDASINPGNSGGPLFNLKGELVGINTMIFSRTGQSGGLGFAIPANEAKKILGDLKKYGRVPRPWLGVLAEQITPQMVEYYGLPVSQGVVVYNLVERGPADRAGLRRGDIILKVGATATDDPNTLERVLAQHQPNDETTIQVLRGSKKMELKIQLHELPKLDELPKGIL